MENGCHMIGHAVLFSSLANWQRVATANAPLGHLPPPPPPPPPRRDPSPQQLDCGLTSSSSSALRWYRLAAPCEIWRKRATAPPSAPLAPPVAPDRVVVLPLMLLLRSPWKGANRCMGMPAMVGGRHRERDGGQETECSPHWDGGRAWLACFWASPGLGLGLRLGSE
jgi:hypothetical protein